LPSLVILAASFICKGAYDLPIAHELCCVYFVFNWCEGYVLWGLLRQKICV
jgi:hypothetical protein